MNEEARKSLVEREWEKNPRAMYEAHREIWRDTVADLTAQLRAARQENERLSDVVTWNIGRCDAWCQRAETAHSIIERAHHESIAGDGRSSVVLAVVREILAEGVAK